LINDCRVFLKAILTDPVGGSQEKTSIVPLPRCYWQHRN